MLSDAAVHRIQEISQNYPNLKSALVPALYVAQRDNGGWLSRDALVDVADELELPESHVYAVATFYSMFHFSPQGDNLVQVCTTSPCGLRGAAELLQCFEQHLDITVGQTTPDGKFTLVETECLAACDFAPLAQINEDYYLRLDEKKVQEVIAALEKGEKPPYAEFSLNLQGAHPIAFTDAELGIDVNGITPAPPIEKIQKEEASPVGT
jgi:NADH dehydrogenase (ubiquinone) flavoprotein 2